MVKAIGIIAEYNPFHNGHLWHLGKCREIASSTSRNNYTVAVMSGNFVQRGEAAIFDKWSRAAMAVKAGVDLVIELPFVFSVRSAQYFAAGAVRLLGKLGIVSHICFGAENADLELLNLAAAKIDFPDTIIKLRQNLKTGKTYAAALAEALGEDSFLQADFLSAPNNILGIEYLRAVKVYAPQIIPVPILRSGAKHHDQKFSGPIASAAAIRRELLTNIPDSPDVVQKAAQVIPPSGAEHIAGLISQGAGPSNFKNLDNIILANFRLKTLEQIAALPEVAEGLENKIAQASLKATSAEELLVLLKSKRYPRTRLQRILIHALVGSTKEVVSLFDKTGPLYARVLAFNEKGRVLLKEIKPNFPIVSKTAGYLNDRELRENKLPPLKSMLAIDVKATDIFALSLPNARFKIGGLDFLNSPFFLK